MVRLRVPSVACESLHCLVCLLIPFSESFCVSAMCAFAAGLVLFASFCSCASAGGFLGADRSADRLSVAQVEQSLLAELAAVSDQRRPLARIEEEFQSMYVALPKNAAGRLDQPVVRYALHRYFVQRHGWYVNGLEPSGQAWGDVPSDGVTKDRVPEYIQGFFARRLGADGLGLQELAVFAATMEDLIHDEASERLRAVYEALQLPTVGGISPKQADAAISTLMMVFIGGNGSNVSAREIDVLKADIRHIYVPWPDMEMWTLDMLRTADYEARHWRNPFVASSVSFTEALRIVESITEHFGSHQHLECSGLKQQLLDREYRGSGRVKLSDFWGKDYDEDSSFLESAEYLRALGVLDEADPQHPSVVMANYLIAPSNCIATGNFYTVCCRDECEALIAHLERDVASPSAEPQHLAKLVSALPSETTAAPRTLSSALLGRLADIAAYHGGRVPLHGRLFAQWLHHAYPRECPFPHAAGTTSTQTPDEWEETTGRSGLTTEEEVKTHIASVAAKSRPVNMDPIADLPWTAVEELVGVHADAQAPWSRALGLLAGVFLAALVSFGGVVARAVHAASSAPHLVKSAKLIV